MTGDELTLWILLFGVLITGFARMNRRLKTIANAIISQGEAMSQELDDLTAQVEKNTSIEESAVTLIQGLAAQITAAGTDPAKLKALTASLTQSASDLAAAIAANTPAAPPA